MAKKAYIGVGNFIPRALPSGYTQVEYLQSTGTQYIDTGFVPNQDTRVVCEAIVPISGTNWLYGARTSASSNAFAFAASTNGYYTTGYNTKTNSFDASLNSDGAIRIDANKSVTTMTSKNGTATINGTSGTFTAPCNLTLFGGNTKGTVTCGSVTIYSCQIYDNGTLVRDYVPCTNAGVAGLYDMANGVFYQNAGTGTFAVGGTYAEVAREVKQCYVGIETEVPIYEETVQTVNITASNISETFTVANGTYYFKGSGGTFTTTNGGKSDTTATTTLTAKSDMTVSFKYSYSSEQNYDKFTLKVAGTTVENAVSGSTTSKTYSGDLKAGQTIGFTYVKDGSQNKNDDKCTFSNMVVTRAVKTQVGSEIKSLARKIKKVYIGVGGVAKLCWGTADIATMPIGLSSGMTDNGVVTMKGVQYRLLTLASSGTITFSEPVQAEVWMCGGGSSGGVGSSSGAAGGAGAYTATGTVTLSGTMAAVVGAGGEGRDPDRMNSGGASSFAGLATKTTSGKNGGTGGGGSYSSSNVGTGDGVTKYPFGDSSYFPNPHCAGGGGGAFCNTPADTYSTGGAGGTNGGNGSARVSARTGAQAYGGAGGNKGGGGGESALMQEGSGNASYYGSGGGGGGSNETQKTYGTGGYGYQGVIYVRIPVNQ